MSNKENNEEGFRKVVLNWNSTNYLNTSEKHREINIS